MTVMERQEIFAQLTEQLGSLLDMDPTKITESSTLLNDLDADSLDILEFIVTLRDEYGIAVSDGEVKQFLSELARFLPDKTFNETERLSDDQLAEVADKLTVGTMVDFVEAQLKEMS
jgi:acyl carrier protein